MTRATREHHLTRKHKIATSYLPTRRTYCQPSRLQILEIDGEWVIDDVMMQGTRRHFWGKKTREKDVVLIVTFDLIGLLPTNNIIAYVTMAYRSL